MDIETSLGCSVYDDAGNSVVFGTLFSHQRAIVVFVRHFFCGSCQAYVKELATQVSKESLESTDTRLIVIGCGEWQVIKTYAEITGFGNGQIFANPDRKLYKALGLTIETTEGTPAGEQKKSYNQQSRFRNALSSVWTALHTPALIGKQGNVSQLGGEFILGPGKTCSYSHMMQHTEDHAEVDDLMKEAGLASAIST